MLSHPEPAGTEPAEIPTNSLGMSLERIPAGEFLMGNHDTPETLARDYPNYEPKRIAELVDEAPVHPVRITRPFYMGRHLVTLGQFRRFVAAAGFQSESEQDGTGGWGYNPNHNDPENGSFEGRDPKYSWRDPGFPQGDDHPVLNVTWNDAVEFCRWLSATEGATYRLPTEAEWEYACRAGTTTRFFSGDDPEGLLAAAKLYDEDTREVFPEWSPYALRGRSGFVFTAPVGSFQPNAFGLYDMHGNAWEWCSDWYDEEYYARSPRDDPQGPATGKVRVRRGGSWHTWSFYTRSSFRNYNDPDTRYLLLGMRVVREVSP